MQDDRILHCKMCNLAYLNFDEMQKHVKEVHWKLFHGDAAPKIKQESIPKVVEEAKEVPKPFESLVVDKKDEEPKESSEKQELIKRHGLLGKMLFGAMESKPDKKEAESVPATEATEQPSISKADEPSTSKDEQAEADITYEVDEKWADLDDDAKVIKILEMQNLITTDILELYEKEEGGGLAGKERTPPGGQSPEQGELFPPAPPDQALDDGRSDAVSITPVSSAPTPESPTPMQVPSSEELKKHISDSEESDEEDEFWRDYDAGIDQTGVPLFDPPIRTSSPPRKMARVRELLEDKFGEAAHVRVDPFFQYLWDQSFKRKDKDIWQNNKMEDVIEAHGWDRRM